MFRSPRVRLWAVLTITIALCALLTVLHKRAEERGSAGAVTSNVRRYVLAPPARAAQATKVWWRSNVSSLFASSRLARENGRLRNEVAELSAQNRDLQDEAVENARLRSLLGFQARSKLSLIPAQVLALKPSPLRDTLTLSRGLRDHVQRKMVVLDPSGALVGQVIDVTTDTCDVLLLTDDLSSVGAVVMPAGRALVGPRTVGICSGSKSPALNLKDLPNDADVRVGDSVITSGLGTIYPKDIPIGHIYKISFDTSTYEKGAEVAPEADFNHLQEAFIVNQLSQNSSDANDAAQDGQNADNLGGNLRP